MKEELIAIKNCYNNVNGGKKVKVITEGKKYTAFFKNGYNVMVVNDIEQVATFRISLFTTISNDRNNKLEQLGI
jgi:hypothetical protein